MGLLFCVPDRRNRPSVRAIVKGPFGRSSLNLMSERLTLVMSYGVLALDVDEACIYARSMFSFCTKVGPPNWLGPDVMDQESLSSDPTQPALRERRIPFIMCL